MENNTGDNKFPKDSDQNFVHDFVGLGMQGGSIWSDYNQTSGFQDESLMPGMSNLDSKTSSPTFQPNFDESPKVSKNTYSYTYSPQNFNYSNYHYGQNDHAQMAPNMNMIPFNAYQNEVSEGYYNGVSQEPMNHSQNYRFMQNNYQLHSKYQLRFFFDFWIYFCPSVCHQYEPQIVVSS